MNKWVCDANASKTYALLSLFYVQLLQYLHQLHVFDLIQSCNCSIALNWMNKKTTVRENYWEIKIKSLINNQNTILHCCLFVIATLVMKNVDIYETWYQYIIAFRICRTAKGDIGQHLCFSGCFRPLAIFFRCLILS